MNTVDRLACNDWLGVELLSVLMSEVAKITK